MIEFFIINKSMKLDMFGYTCNNLTQIIFIVFSNQINLNLCPSLFTTMSKFCIYVLVK